MLLVGVVSGGVETTDERPPGIAAPIRVGRVQQVAVEEEGRARLHLTVDVLQDLARLRDPLRVRLEVFPRHPVLDPAHVV